MTKQRIPKALKGGTSFALDKHRRIVREMPVHVEKRMQDIAARNEILNATEAYNARLERDRVTAAIHNMPPGLQKMAAQYHVGTLNTKLHRLAGKGIQNSK